ncbi:hypothetical protein ACFC5H_09135 [Streptomyces rochei]|uniref:hypothetical protein n=1 Tax=Actinomycetes TaxID=1760 RepID=UPI0035E30C19
MSSAELFADAIDTAVALGWALLAWVAVFAAAGTLALLGTIAVLTAAARALWRRTVRPSWARSRRAAAHDYREAA